jgi:hypothetical protein
MHDLPPFAQFLLILGTITFVLLIAASAGGLTWLIMRRVDKVLLKRATDKSKGQDNVDFTGTYDSKGRKVHRRELYDDMKKKEGKGA